MTPAQLRLAAERLIAVADGKKLQARGFDGRWRGEPDHDYLAAWLASDDCRIAPDEPALPPKPSQEWLDEHGVELTGECRAPCNELYACICPSGRGDDVAEPFHAIDKSLFGGARWILRRREPQVRPWTLETVPACWVKSKATGSMALPVAAHAEGLSIVGNHGGDVRKISYADLLRDFVQRDGSPCGEVVK